MRERERGAWGYTVGSDRIRIVVGAIEFKPQMLGGRNGRKMWIPRCACVPLGGLVKEA